MFAVIVTFSIKSAQWDAFMPLMYANAKSSLEDEPGCHQFDVCIDEQRPNEVFLYELYSDADAFQAHLQTPHFQSFDTATAPMVDEKVAKTYARVN